MTIHLHLRVDERNRVQALLDGDRALAEPVPLDQLPPRLAAAPARAEANRVGPALFRALGGEALLEALDADPDGLLLLHVDPRAEAVPWERATLPDGDLLAVAYSVARVVDRDAAAPPQARPVRQLVVLTADPLVDEQGYPRRRRLDFDAELRGLSRALHDARVTLEAYRIPPTRQALLDALRRGPAVLHLAAHGGVDDQGPQLLLENETGRADRLPGRELALRAPRGYLRLVVLAACLTAAGEPTQRLARALVETGIPAAVGMQGTLPDPLAPALARHLYAALFQGLSLPEALRQARLAMLDEAKRIPEDVKRQTRITDQDLAALPVLYVARNAWDPLLLEDGAPRAALGEPGRVNLPPEVTAPKPFLGREEHLHGLARLYAAGRGVITLTGVAGVGKTALAAAFARRFAWRWIHGVVGFSFAGYEDALPSVAEFSRALAERTLGQQAAHALTDPLTLPEMLQQAGWQGLLVLDNYETVLLALEGERDDGPAHRIHRLVYRLAQAGFALLLTSRQQPANLPGEATYPRQGHLLGLPEDEAAALFLHHSERAKKLPWDQRQRLAHEVARATEGHPLALELLAHEFDTSPEVAPEEFLQHWAEELEQAEAHGLPQHHRTFTAALDRTYRRLDPETQRRARLLSVFAFPFLAEAAAFTWGLQTEDGQPDRDAARKTLIDLHRRGLLEVAGTFAGSDVPAAFRWLPPVREALAAKRTPEERATADAALAAYGAWLARRAYGEIYRDPGLAQLVRESMPALDAAVAALTGVEQLWHIKRTAWLKKAYGDYAGALELLQPYDRKAPPEGADEETQKAYSSLWYELADVYRVRGDLDRALDLYEQARDILDDLGDLKGKAATLHEMANVLVTRGELDQAMDLYRQSLAIQERLGDLRGKAMTLGMMGQVLFAAGRHAEGIRAVLQGYLLLRRLNIEPQSQKTLEKILAKMRRQAGPQVFDPIWAEATEGALLPEWLVGATGRSPTTDEDALQQALAAALDGKITPDDLPEEIQQALAALILALQQMSPQDLLVQQARDAVLAVRAGRADRDQVINQLKEVVAQIRAQEPPDSPWHDAAAFLDAAIALLEGREPPPVPERYREIWRTLTA